MLLLEYFSIDAMKLEICWDVLAFGEYIDNVQIVQGNSSTIR